MYIDTTDKFALSSFQSEIPGGYIFRPDLNGRDEKGSALTS